MMDEQLTFDVIFQEQYHFKETILVAIVIKAEVSDLKIMELLDDS